MAATLPNYTSRQCTYLVRSRTGIYSFRWNIIANAKPHQPKLSLKTREFLTDVRFASDLASQLLPLVNPTIDEIKSIYDDFRGKKSKESRLLVSIDIMASLTDLSAKS